MAKRNVEVWAEQHRSGLFAWMFPALVAASEDEFPERPRGAHPTDQWLEDEFRRIALAVDTLTRDAREDIAERLHRACPGLDALRDTPRVLAAHAFCRRVKTRDGYRALYEARVRLAGCGSSLLAWATSVLPRSGLRRARSLVRWHPQRHLQPGPPPGARGRRRGARLRPGRARERTDRRAGRVAGTTPTAPRRRTGHRCRRAGRRGDALGAPPGPPGAAPAVPKTRTASPPLGGPAERQRKRSKFWADTLSLFACRFVPPRTALSGSAS